MTHPNATWHDRVPKVELHLHLEGAIPLDALWTLVQKYGGDPDVPDVAALQTKFVYRDFPHFIQTWVWQTRFLREYDDFTFIAEAIARDLAAQNVRYVEAFCSPPDFTRHGLRAQPLIEAIRTGLDRVHGITVQLVPDLVRDFGPLHGLRLLMELAELKGAGVIGIGIGGSEQAFPPEPFAPVYAEARRIGFHTSAHAGEAAGAASIWGALRALNPDRIGHGTRAVEDPALIDYLAEHRVPIECNPLSNVRTGVIPSVDKHPARLFFERGIPFSVNTDDPKMFGNSLADEYRALEQHLGFSRDEVRQVILNGIETAWLEPDAKRRLAAAFRSDPNWRNDSA
ncbi:MAG: adenosine deaminase [Chloroflexi bacterium]|nr:adenosine deaminase [Chloroflexota bacterium]